MFRLEFPNGIDATLLVKMNDRAAVKGAALFSISRVIYTSKIRRCPGDMETSGHTGLASLTIPTSKQIKRERKVPHAKSTYRCSTRSRISSVRPWFQNCVPI